MYRIHQIKVRLDEDLSSIPDKIGEKLGRNHLKIKEWTIVRESIDARRKDAITRVYTIDFSTEEPLDLEPVEEVIYRSISPSKARLEKGIRPVVVGFGPAGIFASLILAEAGLRPLVLERGEDMDRRSKSVETFWEKKILNPNSNVQFGEGGAGTFSDGKLTTGIKDVRIRKVLNEFVLAGGPEEILYKQKPHIGTDVLREVVKNIRKKIISLGGEIRFDSLVSEIEIKDHQVSALMVGGERIPCEEVVFAMGHSARDTFRMFQEKGVDMSQKSFSIGVRIEHPQDLIDQSQYGKISRELGLPVAEYKLSHRCKNGRGVYTFCMCPGGEVILSSSQEGAVVTNGMSYHKRDSGKANSGLLVDVRVDDFGSPDVLAGVEFQEKYERLAFVNGGGDYSIPTTTWGQLRDGTGKSVENSLPEFAVEAMKEAMPYFGKKIKGFDGDDGVIRAVESRSSSPIRITREKESFYGLAGGQRLVGFYPCGEGAGYAGGIMSAAVDGIKVGEAIIKK